jgi:hypothetical protein
MKSKQILLDTINHKQPERIPVDFGGTNCSGMHVTCVAQLRDYYGLDRRPVKIHEPFQLLGMIDADLKEAIGIDVEGVNPPNTLFGFPNDQWKEWRLDNGLEVLVSQDFNTIKDQSGNTFIYPQGDLNARPSGRMPYGGFYFDAIIRQEEIDEDSLDPDDNLEEFTMVDDKTIDYFKTSLNRAYDTGRGVLANIGGTGLGDIALVPGTFMKNPKGIRDITEWYISTAVRKDLLHEIFEKQTDIALYNMKKIHEAAGGLIDVVFICGTDFGTQTGTFCSKDTFLELYAPYYRKMNDWIHSNTEWKTFKHCCGAVEPFMKLFVDAGFDIINPVQCSANGMDPVLLKKNYGKDLTFWGGGVDTQRVLPFGSESDVREQVLERCGILSAGGGFVFNAVHNVQAKTPVKNIVAMIDAIHEFNGSK